MGLFDWLRRGSGRELVTEPDLDETRSTPVDQLDRLGGWTIGRESTAGVVVSEVSALQVSTVMACVSRIAMDVATTPLGVWFENANGSSAPARRTNAWRLLARQPNPVHTALEARGMITAQAALFGDGYAFIFRNVDGEPIEIWPLHKREVGVRRVGFEPIYTVHAYEGRIAGEFTRQNILHLRPQTMDGLTGLDRLIYARNAIGLAQAAQSSQALSFKNGNRMPGYWTTSEKLQDTVLTRLADALRAATTGSNQWKSPLVDMGVEYKTAGQSFEQAQMIETRRHEMLEVCAAFGVLPAVLGIDDKTTSYASTEAMFQAHIRHTLRPWFAAWEQAIDRDLLDGLGPLHARFDTSDMEKATTKDRAESYRALAETLVMMPNEMRRLEGLEPISGLDELWLEMMRGKSGLADVEPGNGGTNET